MSKKLPLPFLVAAMAVSLGARAYARETMHADPEFDEILSMDIAGLSVTSVSKRAQKLTDTAAAVYVITQEDIRRSGAYSIPEALRLAPGVQVAKVASNRWAVSARGFNNPLANKLLVLIDGRTIYTPIFSGVYWDDQSTLIEDIERIEVIRGPGASLYGANAVNGVINIITKNASETQGNLVSATGTVYGGLLEGRHGAKLGKNAYYRAYATYQDTGKSKNPTGTRNADDWYRARTGFRVDTDKVEGNDYTLQGDLYYGRQGALSTLRYPVAPFSLAAPFDSTSTGGNILGRWTHDLQKGSQLMLQGYLDYYARREVLATQQVTTADLQMQHSLALDKRNNFIWGGGARGFRTQGEGTYAITLDDLRTDHYILNTFLQNEYAVLPDELYFTIGSKFEYYDLSGFVVEPSARFSWHPVPKQTVWGAVSRAIRTPSIIEKDINLLADTVAGPTELRLVGNGAQRNEELIAYELGHRVQPRSDLSFDTALFFNDYSKLQTIGQPLPAFVAANGNTIQQYPYTNFGSASAYGVEFAAAWQIDHDWSLKGSYTYTHMDIDSHAGAFLSLESEEALTPRHQFAIQSYYNLSETVHWDNLFYYVSKLGAPVGSSYLRYDTRLAWLAAPGLELSLIGKNLLDGEHPEYATAPQAEVSRVMIGQVLWKF